MNIGIIGCGWLGKDLAKNLKNEGHTVFGTKTHIEGIQDLERQNIKGTLFKVNETNIEINEKNLFEEAQVLIISITPRIRKRSTETAIKEMQVLTHFLNSLPQKPHIIYLNSTAIYNSEIENCTEEVMQLQSPYYDFEKIISTAVNYTILRLAGLVGPDRIIINRMAGEERTISKNASINLVAKPDVIVVISTLILNLEISKRQIFNICSSDHPLKHVFYIQKCQQAGLENPIFRFKEDKELKKVANNKIKAVLNVQFKYDKIEDFFNEILN